MRHTQCTNHVRIQSPAASPWMIKCVCCCFYNASLSVLLTFPVMPCRFVRRLGSTSGSPPPGAQLLPRGRMRSKRTSGGGWGVGGQLCDAIQPFRQPVAGGYAARLHWGSKGWQTLCRLLTTVCRVVWVQNNQSADPSSCICAATSSSPLGSTTMCACWQPLQPTPRSTEHPSGTCSSTVGVCMGSCFSFSNLAGCLCLAASDTCMQHASCQTSAGDCRSQSPC
jgi:hypothetical protein